MFINLCLLYESVRCNLNKLVGVKFLKDFIMVEIATSCYIKYIKFIVALKQ